LFVPAQITSRGLLADFSCGQAKNSPSARGDSRVYPAAIIKTRGTTLASVDQEERRMRCRRTAIVLTILILVPVSAWSQADERKPFVWDVARAVLIDPTTFAPALISHEAMRQDWKTSQVLFAYGWLEQNPRFTVSGRPNDVPVSYEEGTARIRGVALMVLRYSTLNNVSAQIAERFLIARYPRRKTLIRTLSWVERIAFASILTYSNSADHFRQASSNRRLARGYVR
jgi:hypothetical protein